jgi:hypothetical protein
MTGIGMFMAGSFAMMVLAMLYSFFVQNRKFTPKKGEKPPEPQAIRLDWHKPDGTDVTFMSRYKYGPLSCQQGIQLLICELMERVEALEKVKK